MLISLMNCLLCRTSLIHARRGGPLKFPKSFGAGSDFQHLNGISEEGEEQGGSVRLGTPLRAIPTGRLKAPFKKEGKSGDVVAVTSKDISYVSRHLARARPPPERRSKNSSSP
jgi:hypothetical protein